MQKSAVPILVFRCLMNRILCIKDDFIKFVEKKKNPTLDVDFMLLCYIQNWSLKILFPKLRYKLKMLFQEVNEPQFHLQASKTNHSIIVPLRTRQQSIIGLGCSRIISVQFHAVLLCVNGFALYVLGRLCSLQDSIIESLML